MKTLINCIKKTAFYAGLAALIGLSSCAHDDQSIDRADLEKLYDQNSNLKREFAKALVNAMKESKMLRSVLKTEALKMFDKDYDVLYVLIKDKRLENGSVEELMAKHLGGKEKLDEIISQYPTLTIFVPELPNHSFSAELWNTHDVPAVAIRTRKSTRISFFINDVPFISVHGTEGVISGKYIPAFPILVIKESERVVALNDENQKWFNQLETKTVYNGGWVRIKFWNKAFDPSKTPIDQKERLDFDPKVKKAYEINKDANGFQRDYIYYGIMPSNLTGAYQEGYKEHITHFSMIGDPEAAYEKINLGNYWTDGSFELAVVANVKSKHAGVQLTNVLSLCSDDLFTIEYKRTGKYYFKPSVVSLKTAVVDSPFFGWKLEEYSPTIKMHLEEINLTETVTQSVPLTAYFATLSVNPTTGVSEKTGFGLGTNPPEEKTITYDITYFPNSNSLGEVTIDFSNKVLLGDGTTIREYRTGYYKFTLEPRRVQ